MYQCSNCTANLKFDIASQQMLCEHCGLTMDPYDVEEKKDACESVIGEDEYEVTIFSCPQCGGELLCYDDTAATFCSYCGGSTILNSRISREKRPQKIIPFKKTKEQCREAYAKMISKSMFVPREMLDEDYISRFRSIYMPYWVYTFEKSGPVNFKGVRKDVDPDTAYTSIYNIECEVEAKYKGMAYDASSSFSDSLSNAIAPFEWRDAKPFTPAFLSGFYADTSDIDASYYEADAKKMVTQEICRKMQEDPICDKFHYNDLFERILTPNTTEKELAMLPVWFLAFRKWDRVSYAVVNGQTGEVAGDLPIDKKEFTKWSVIWSIPLMILMVLFVRIPASVLLMFTVFLAAISCYISCSQKKELRAKENYMDDKGMWYPVTPDKGAKFEINLSSKMVYVLFVIGSFFTFLTVLDGDAGRLFNLNMELVGVVFYFVLTFFATKFTDIKFKSKHNRETIYNLTIRDFLDTLKKTGLGIVLSLLILLIKPAGDFWYYLASMVTMGLIIWDIMGILKQHNLLVTRPLPQFGKRGGEADGK